MTLVLVSLAVLVICQVAFIVYIDDSIVRDFTRWWTEKSESRSGAAMTLALSKQVNLPRVPGERLSAWSSRVLQAHDELSEASRAFIEAAQSEGWIEHEEERQVLYGLPLEHPAAIRLARARGVRLLAPSGQYRDTTVVYRGVQ